MRIARKPSRRKRLQINGLTVHPRLFPVYHRNSASTETNQIAQMQITMHRRPPPLWPSRPHLPRELGRQSKPAGLLARPIRPGPRRTVQPLKSGQKPRQILRHTGSPLQKRLQSPSAARKTTTARAQHRRNDNPKICGPAHQCILPAQRRLRGTDLPRHHQTCCPVQHPKVRSCAPGQGTQNLEIPPSRQRFKHRSCRLYRTRNFRNSLRNLCWRN